MKTLNFGDALTESTFSWGNEFIYGEPQYSNLWFSDNSINRPFILRGVLGDVRNLQFGSYGNQFRRRKLTGPKIEEILDKARLPIMTIIESQYYLMGKGWLSLYPTASSNYIKLLFVACTKGSGEVTSMEDVTFFLNKELFTNDLYKPFQSTFKKLVASHPGNVMMVRDVNQFIGEKINIPALSNLRELKQVKEKIIMEVLKDEFPVTLENGTI